MMRIRYSNRRAVVSLRGLVRVRLKIRRCETRSCGDTIRRGGRKRKPRWLCPSMMDVIALAGTLRLIFTRSDGHHC